MATFATPEPISIRLELGVGDVRILASDRADTVVAVRPSDPANPADVTAAEQTLVDFASGRLVVRAPKSWRAWTPSGGRESVEVELQVPSGSHLDGETGLAALRASGRLGDVGYKTGLGDVRLDETGSARVKTGLGDIAVLRAGGDVDLKTGSGRIEIHAAGGRAVIKNSNGDTMLGEVAGDLRVQSANGTISLDHAAASVVTRTAFGDIRMGTVTHGTVEAHTACGQVEVGVRDGVAAWLDLHTSFGQVRCELDDSREPEPGQPTVEVKAHTAMGDIVIHRVSAVAGAAAAAGMAGPAASAGDVDR